MNAAPVAAQRNTAPRRPRRHKPPPQGPQFRDECAPRSHPLTHCSRPFPLGTLRRNQGSYQPQCSTLPQRAANVANESAKSLILLLGGSERTWHGALRWPLGWPRQGRAPRAPAANCARSLARGDVAALLTAAAPDRSCGMLISAWIPERCRDVRASIQDRPNGVFPSQGRPDRGTHKAAFSNHSTLVSNGRRTPIPDQIRARRA